MNIADNIIRQKLTNVYFIWGRGKSTIANELSKNFGCYIYARNTVGTNEGRIPGWVMENGIKCVIWNDETSVQQTTAEVAEHFGFKKKENDNET